jgi:hypothetical protein
MSENHYDIFNGDADGICALHQYRLVHPAPTGRRLITGVKRDIRLLQRIEHITDSTLTVFDISLDSNRASLTKLLEQGNTICYFDHHFAGDIPADERLTTHIDTSSTCCTSLIVNAFITGAHSLWAICGAFGDNLHRPALTLAEAIGLSDEQTATLRELGELLNYNGYGTALEDLHFRPDDLYQAVSAYRNPFDFSANSREIELLRHGYQEDLTHAMAVTPLCRTGKNRVYRFPQAPWARRVAGVFANLKARETPDAAIATINENPDNTLRISVRAPLSKPSKADMLCRSFPTGGGRTAAAGINALPAAQLADFLDQFMTTYPD